jgi:hypothetical protein
VGDDEALGQIDGARVAAEQLAVDVGRQDLMCRTNLT